MNDWSFLSVWVLLLALPCRSCVLSSLPRRCRGAAAVLPCPPSCLPARRGGAAVACLCLLSRPEHPYPMHAICNNVTFHSGDTGTNRSQLAPNSRRTGAEPGPNVVPLRPNVEPCRN